MGLFARLRESLIDGRIAEDARLIGVAVAQVKDQIGLFHL